MADVRLGDFDEIAEDGGVFNFEGFNPSSFGFAGLEIGDPLFAFFGGGSEFIEARVIAFAEDTTFTKCSGRLIGNGAI